MKNALRFMILVLALTGLYGCQKKGDTLLIWSTNGYHSLVSWSREQGDRDKSYIGFSVRWQKKNCELQFANENRQVETVQLSPGDTTTIRIGSIPVMTYEVHLCSEGETLPAPWQERVERLERIQQSQAEYSSLEGYASVRDASTETAIIQEAFAAIGVSVKAEAWYDFFVRATWYNGDCSFSIAKAVAKKESQQYELFLTDKAGNELEIQGEGTYVWMSQFNGTPYYAVIE